MALWDSLLERGEGGLGKIWENLGKNNLWQRMLKMWLASTICIIIALIPGIEKIYGRATYFAVITTVFGHPGRRLGMMAEALLLALSGTLIGIGWAVLGIYLGSLAYPRNKSAAYAIRGTFLSLSYLFHGFLRSQTPRLFIFVLLLVIMATVLLTSTAVAVSPQLVTQLLYPVLTATAVLLLVNVSVFPEFSSGFLGRTTLETLDETVEALRKSGEYFVETSGGQIPEGPEIKKETTDSSTQAGTAKDEALPMPQKCSSSNHGNIFSRVFREKDKEEYNSKKKLTLKDLTDAKSKLRASLASCKSVQEECNFELAFSVLRPRYLKPISEKAMKKLVGHTISLIGACESKYALMGEEETEPSLEPNKIVDKGLEDGQVSSSGPGSSRPETPTGDGDARTDKQGKNKNKKSKKKQEDLEVDNLEMVKPRREIEFADKKLLKYLVDRISVPLTDLQRAIDRSVDVVNSCVAFSYDVPTLPNGTRAPKGIILPEVDVYIETLEQALLHFDNACTSALESAIVLEELQNKEVDIMPRDETFLIASFILNLRQAGASTLEMLKHSRTLVERREERRGRKTLYFPHIRWRKWLFSGGDDEGPLARGRQKSRQHETDADADEDSDAGDKHKTLPHKNSKDPDHEAAAGIGQARGGQTKNNRKEILDTPDVTKHTSVRQRSWTLKRREGLASFLDWAQSSEHVIYAFKFTIGALLVSWPALVPSWNLWYSLNRGLWAALQLVLILEVAIGTSIKVFILRSVGTTLGCLWGYAAYSARDGNRVVCGAVLSIGVIPSAYFLLGTQYVKAGMVFIISMAVVALSTELHTIPGTATENFFKRLVSFLLGGSVALLVELTVFPAKARNRLVESLAASIRRIGEMEGCIAYGMEDGSSDEFPLAIVRKFEKVSEKAKAALDAAETYLPFCKVEPRLKGSFDGLAMIYGEILFVLHQIVDRMDNMIQLRIEYGSVVLEEIHHLVLPYRLNLAGAITLILFAVHEALTTKLPLPQFLPSARLAHLRMVNRVREVIITSGKSGEDDGNLTIGRLTRRHAVRKKFMATNAALAASEECIEYLEELIELTKLLVGANEFKTGLLTRPTYLEYASGIRDRHVHRDSVNSTEVTIQPIRAPTAEVRRRTGTVMGKKGEEEKNGIPNALRRIQSKRKDAKLENGQSNHSAQEHKGRTA